MLWKGLLNHFNILKYLKFFFNSNKFRLITSDIEIISNYLIIIYNIYFFKYK